jgi:predicted kinase
VSKLTITRGLPGSGKTTWARQQQDAKPGLWRVNRDDLRAMVVPSWAFGDENDEDMLTVVQHRAIHGLLYNGLDVIVDDTNLSERAVEGLRAVAVDTDSAFEVVDFTHVPLETCVERDAARPNPVGAQVIRRMHERYLATLTGSCTCPHPADSHNHTGCLRRIGSCDTCHCTAKRCPACGGVGERLNGCQSLSHIEVRK